MSARGDHTRYVVTREEYTAMRAAVERCREAEGEIKVQGHMLNTQYLEAEDDRAKCEAWEERATKAEAALAKVTAERDEARRELDRALMDMAAGFAGITPVVE